MRIAKPEKSRHARGSGRLGLILLVAGLLMPAPDSFANGLIDVRINGEPPLPAPVASELSDIFTDTLSKVLFDEESGEMGNLELAEIADAIRTGINIVIEPKGYTVFDLELDIVSSPAVAIFYVHPTGWTSEDPNAVTDLYIHLNAAVLDPYWFNRFQARIDENHDRVYDTYGRYLLGLPASASDSDWAFDLVLPALIDSDPLADIFPNFTLSYTVQPGKVAEVTIDLHPAGDIVELIRPRMYSSTLYNVILDRMRERLVADAAFIQGMPKAEVEAASEDIGAMLSGKLEQDGLAQQLYAYASVTIEVLPLEPTARIDAIIESSLYHLGLEALIDFGNESRGSSEIQGRFGLLLARGFEVFVNLNYFTNDNALNTDVALGLRPTRGTFAAVGYDLHNESMKYFIEQRLSPGLTVRGEIFEDNLLNEFGMTYQFQQYLSGGVFTNGDNEFWVRAIFTL